jgi:hypothetical protein
MPLQKMNNTTVASTTVPSDACAHSVEDDDQSYDLALHITSVFVILIVSLLGASISVVSLRVKRLRINSVIMNTGKFFGSG